MNLTLLKDVASPWGTVKAGGSIEVPDAVGAQWTVDGVGFAPEDVIDVEVSETPSSEQETVTPAPKENAAKPPPSRRGKPREIRV